MSLLRPSPRRLWPRSARGRRIAAGAAILLGATLTSVSIFATGPVAQPEPHIEKAWPVAVTEAYPEPRSPSFTAYGRVESNRVAELATDLVAPVAAVHVREGDWVSQGDLLVALDDREVALQVAEREAALAEQQARLASIESERSMLERTLAQARSVNRIAQDKLTRHQELMDRRLISQSLLDEVIAQANQATIDLETHQRRLADLPNRLDAQEAMVARARTLLERAQLDLDKTAIRAPFAGPVLAVHVAPGDRTRAGAPLVELADATAFEVRLQVPDTYQMRFQRHLDGGEGVTAHLGDGRELALTRLARRVRPGQSGLDAFFSLAAPLPPAAPASPTAPAGLAGPAGAMPALGRVVDLRIRLPEEPDVVALPIASLYDNDRIYAVEDQRLQAIDVERVGETHTEDGEYRVLVRSPELYAGRRVITTQLPKAVSGLLVEAS